MSDDAPVIGHRVVVSLVVIGNEVLCGKVEEQNARYLIKRLRALGARVREIVFIEDDVAAIAEAVSRVSRRSDAVITTGGVGPTHDDVTVAGVAMALGVPVVEDEAIVAMSPWRLGRDGSRGCRRGRLWSAVAGSRGRSSAVRTYGSSRVYR